VRAVAEVRALLTLAPRPLVVTSDGAVFELSQRGVLTFKGGFAGRVDAVVQLGFDRLVALVDGRRLSELDLSSLALTTRFLEPDLELYRPLAHSAGGELRVLAAADLFLGFEPAGKERFRAALPANVGGARANSNEILLDERGASLFVRSSQDLLAIRADGSVFRVDGTACAEPLRPASLHAGSVVFACRSGIVVRLDDAPGALSVAAEKLRVPQ
jgi:hypothetical protein